MTRERWPSWEGCWLGEWWGREEALPTCNVFATNVGNASVSASALSSELSRIAQEGHAIARHGEGVTNAQLINRATTGYAPDGSAVIYNGQVVIPPSSTAFNSNAFLVAADQIIRNRYLDRAIALSKPGIHQIVIEGVDMGTVIGRGYDRVSSSVGTHGPLQFHSNLSRVRGVYSYDATTGTWRTTTIFPQK